MGSADLRLSFESAAIAVSEHPSTFLATFAITVPLGRLEAEAAVLVVAEIEGFRHDYPAAWPLKLSRGDAAGSVAFGAMTEFLKMTITIDDGEPGTSIIRAKWSWNWWQGIPGYFRNRRGARQFAERLAKGIEDVIRERSMLLPADGSTGGSGSS